MGENHYFERALSDFTYETAIGGAVRHLADSGYTVRQIVEKLDFPVSYERVQKAVWEHLSRQGTILPEPPGTGKPKEKVTYVREYDQYGKASFRRVAVREETEKAEEWTVQMLDSTASLVEMECSTGGGSSMKEGDSREGLIAWIRGKLETGERGNAYISLDFGLVARKDPAQYEAMLAALDIHEREYVTGLPWVGRRVYHKLDSCGLEILLQLYGAGLYRGEFYFRKNG